MNDTSSPLWQHGRGTQIWMLRRTDGSQYSQNNRYTGDYLRGQRHGQGRFFYAGGGVYEGEWRNDKKHGKVNIILTVNMHMCPERFDICHLLIHIIRDSKSDICPQGKFIFKEGHVFEGEFVDDQMMTNELQGNRAPTPLCGKQLQHISSIKNAQSPNEEMSRSVKTLRWLLLVAGALPLSGSDSSVLVADMALNIDSLLDNIPEKKRNTERKQVRFCFAVKSSTCRMTLPYVPVSTCVSVGNRWSLWC